MRAPTTIMAAAGVFAVLGGLAVGAVYADEDWDDEPGGWHRGGPSGWHHGGPPGRVFKLFETFDADGDGAITRAEVDRVCNERFARRDANGDGSLSLEEYQALWLDAMHERMVDRFQDYDDDGDAAVTGEEFAEPFAHMVDRLERDGDGAVTMEEVHERFRHDKRGHRKHDRGDD